jgi:hypothetical protein
MSHPTPNLDNLPTELLLEICTYIPSSSSACLALTSQLLYRKIPPSLFRDLPARNLADYKVLLRQLDKDCPHIIICDFCNSLHGRALPSAEELDENDYFLAVHEPIEPSGESRNVVLNVKRSYLDAVLLRASRAAGTLHNQGLCHSRFTCKGKALLSFPDGGAYENGHNSDEDMGFSATVFWNAERPRVIPRRKRAGPTFTHSTLYKVVLSTALLSGAPRFENMRTVLGTMGIRCCSHCPMGAVESEVICKLEQMFHTEERGKCSCAHGQPEQTCLKHKHVGHQGRCSCSIDVEVKIVGGRGIEIKIWRYGKKMESVGRARLRRRYQVDALNIEFNLGPL